MPQRSDEWYAVRRGKLTASNAATISANGKGLETYVYETLAEKYSNGSKDGYLSADMERGIELEDIARKKYSINCDEMVEEIGFIEIDEHSGCSPDGLVGNDGGLEIKCPNDTNYFKLLVNGESMIEKKYLWQVQMCMFVTRRDWWDLLFHNPNFDRDSLVFRIKKDHAMQEKIAVGLDKGRKLIIDLEKKYGKA
jgi:putative phage-type endonuclease